MDTLVIDESNDDTKKTKTKEKKKKKQTEQDILADAIKKVINISSDNLFNKSVKQLIGSKYDNLKSNLLENFPVLEKIRKSHAFDFYKHVHPSASTFGIAQDAADVATAEDPGKVLTGKFIGAGGKIIYHGAKTLLGIVPIKGVDDAVEFYLEEAGMRKGDELTDRLREIAGVEFVNGDLQRIDGKADIADYRDSYWVVPKDKQNYKTGNANYDNDNTETIKARNKFFQEHGLINRLRKNAGVEVKNGKVRRIKGKVDAADYRQPYWYVSAKDQDYKTGNANYDNSNSRTVKVWKQFVDKYGYINRLRKNAGVEVKNGKVRRIKEKADAADYRQPYWYVSAKDQDYKTGNANYDNSNSRTVKVWKQFVDKYGYINRLRKNAGVEVKNGKVSRIKEKADAADYRQSYSNSSGKRKNYRTGNSNYDNSNKETVQRQQNVRKRISNYFKPQKILNKIRKRKFWPFPFKFADGGFVKDTTLSYVGEDGPEAIIPLGAKRRQRGLDLWNQAGAMLGVPGYANGAIVGGNAADTAKKSKKKAVNKTGGKGKTSSGNKKSGVKVSVGNISINVKGSGDGAGKNVDLLQLLKAQKGQVSDELCSIIADAVEGAYKNIPVA